MGQIKNFTDFRVWQEGHKLVLQIYNITKKFPKSELYGIVSQMRRCAVSITSNVAEGFGRKSYKEKVQFFYQSQGSLTELKNQLHIVKDVNYILEDEFNKLYQQANLTHKLLQGLISKSKSYAEKS